MSEGLHLPPYFTVDQIEVFLDCVAIVMARWETPEDFAFWFEFLEQELELKRRTQSTVATALEREKRLRTIHTYGCF